ncbi:OB-fold domain-containing protein [Yinghuangia aomiensis]
MEYDPETGEELAREFVEVGPAGTVVSWTWVAEPGKHHPLDRPFAYALIKLDGADTNLLHVLDAGSEDAVSTGMRVAPRSAGRAGRPHRRHRRVRPRRDPGGPRRGRGAGRPDHGLLLHDHLHRRALPDPGALRGEACARASSRAGAARRCNQVFLGRGYCSVDAIVLGEEHEEVLPDFGVVSNYTIVTPTPYPGQKETEPFARASVVLDGDEMVIAQQQIIGIPVSEIRVGLRVKARVVRRRRAQRRRDHQQGLGHRRGLHRGWLPHRRTRRARRAVHEPGVLTVATQESELGDRQREQRPP